MLDVRGTRLAATITGDGPRTFVWGHGLVSDRASEDALALLDFSAAVPDGVSLVRYDARGHGRSDAAADPADVRWSELGRDMVGVADAVGADRFVAGGGSMGCATALHAAVDAPERVEALVLMMAPTAWETRAAQAQMYAAGVAWVREQPQQALEAMAAGLETTPPLGEVISAEYPEAASILATHMRGLDPQRLAVIFAGAAKSDLPSPGEIAGLGCPTLILAWEGDDGHPLSTAQRLHDLLAGSDLRVAGSMADVRGWGSAVRAFLAEPPPIR